MFMNEDYVSDTQFETNKAGEDKRFGWFLISPSWFNSSHRF